MLEKLAPAARRLLGARGVRLLRALLGGAYAVLHPKPEWREHGVTAVMCTMNDPDWVEAAVESIAGAADELLVVDSSSDETPELILEAARRAGLRVRLYRAPPGDLAEARNLALREARFKWILVWDSDFIASRRLVRLLEEARSDPKWPGRGLWLVYWPFHLLVATPFHVHREKLHVEHWMYTWSPWAHYSTIRDQLGRPVEALITPPWYRELRVSEPLGLHLAYVRRPERLYLKHVWWTRKEELEARMRSGGLEAAWEYARRVAIEEMGTSDLREAGVKLIRRMLREQPLEPWSRIRHGEYPEKLKPYAKKFLEEHLAEVREAWEAAREALS